MTQYEDDFVQRAADQSLRERDKELAQKKDSLAQSQKRIATRHRPTKAAEIDIFPACCFALVADIRCITNRA